ncbi:hypothetical protein HNY73_004158 [Argiope bruennichi]|uniref:Uncharacterized protein n=1 Tax=Argiope bruennichi TaxID=94029 RepID=A0A8T0FSB8_ARGBR|nr:hypothetical protein HNY73_004158 [Argiope bruennichi]
MNLWNLIACTCLLGIFPMCISEESVEHFVDCLEDEICLAKDGMNRGTYCLELMKERPIEIFLDIMKDYYPETNKMYDVIEEMCLDLKRAVEAFFYYFEESDRRNQTAAAVTGTNRKGTDAHRKLARDFDNYLFDLK